MFEYLTLSGLFIFLIIREVMHHLQVTKLQELLKSVDVTEYYRARQLNTRNNREPSPSANEIKAEANELSLDDPGFDITKVAKLNVDGDEREIKIYS